MIFSVASFIHCIYQIEKKMVTTSLPSVQVFCLIPSLGLGALHSKMAETLSWNSWIHVV